jgi:hypothetical protein
LLFILAMITLYKNHIYFYNIQLQISILSNENMKLLEYYLLFLKHLLNYKIV